MSEAKIEDGPNKGRTVDLPEIEVSTGHEDPATDQGEAQTLQDAVTQGEPLNPNEGEKL